jgi:hypothetical protein
METKEDKQTAEELRNLFGEMIRQRSPTFSSTYKNIYIKHFNNFDTADVDQSGQAHYKYAKEKGLPTEKERLDCLDKEESWTKLEEENLTTLRKRLSNLMEAKEKLFIKSETEPIEKEIADLSLEVGAKLNKRSASIGLCCETFTEKKMHEEFVLYAVYKDEDLKERLFSKEEFDELEPDDLSELVDLYKKYQLRFDDISLKRVSMSNFFLNFYYLCDDNPTTFWGKPVVELTYYQATLFSHARFFKNTLSQSKHKPPTEMFKDPDSLIEWMNSANQAEEMMEKLDERGKDKEGKEKVAGATSLVGATKEDLEYLGIDTETQGVSLAEQAKKKGGTLDMSDMLKIHGVS